MSLTGALSIASSGLDAVQYALSVSSQNVANANTTGYVRETASLVSVEGTGIGSGVRAGTTLQASDPGLQQQNWAQDALVSGLSTTSSALDTINTLLGSAATSDTSGSSSSGTLSDLLGSLQSAFVSLSSDPSQSASQQSVVSAANAFAQRANSLSSAYQAQRQTAQDTITSGVSTVSSDLSTIGSLSDRIVLLTAQGADTADLKSQRNAAMSDLAQYVSVNFRETSTGDMLVKTSSGLSLPTRGDIALSTEDAAVDANSAYPGSIPAITLGGQDVTKLLTGGSIGAAVTLRDTTLPTMQAQLDSLTSVTASRFDAAGLDLFTTSDGSLPGTDGTKASPSGQLGFSSQITVNPKITADTTLVRDGTTTPSDNTSGSADYQGIITAVLDDSFGTGQATASSTGLGVNGTLSTGYSGAGSLTALAATLTSNQAATATSASSRLTTEQAVQTKLSSALATATGVNVDDEMANVVSLQNSYAANAKVISAVQSMFTALLNAVGT